MTLEQLHTLLELGIQYGASDIHLRPNEPPGYRVHGAFSQLKYDKLSPSDTAAVAAHVINDPAVVERLEQVHELDVGFGVANLARFRVHIYRQRGVLALVMRVIPPTVKTIDELGLPAVLKDIALLDRGLVLVSGPGGCGKTATLAAMIDHINRQRRYHIVTVEDPVESLHTSHQSSVSQREVGRDTASYADALHAVQRQDPDVIMIGELRDSETSEIALRAAETGRLILTAASGNDTIQTIASIVAAFPPSEAQAARNRLSENIKAVVTQRLLRRSDGKSRVPACEILLATLMARECIRDASRLHELKGIIEKGADQRMQSLDGNLAELFQRGEISREVAMHNALNRAELERRLTIG